MTTEQTEIIAACWRLTLALVASEPPEWKRWERVPWEQQMQHGPRYAVSQWFGPQRERERMRYRRALDVLERDGLVTLHREWGDRLTNVALTDAGEAIAKRLTGIEGPTAEGAADG